MDTFYRSEDKELYTSSGKHFMNGLYPADNELTKLMDRKYFYAGNDVFFKGYYVDDWELLETIEQSPWFTHIDITTEEKYHNGLCWIGLFFQDNVYFYVSMEERK